MVKQLSVNGEQRHVLTAVFDGHGNELCAQFCVDHFARIVETELAREGVAAESVLTRAMQALDDEWELGLYGNFLFRIHRSKVAKILFGSL